jgi:hypothetical protein
MKLFSLKSNLSSSLLACSLALGLFAPGSRMIAQTSLHLVADVPFDFRSGSQLMPAGKYDIRQLSESFVILRPENQHRSQILMTMNTGAYDRPTHSKLVFHRYGNKYFLYQVWSAERSGGLQIPKGHAEKEMLRAQNNVTPSLTELALNEVPRQ